MHFVGNLPPKRPAPHVPSRGVSSGRDPRGRGAGRRDRVHRRPAAKDRGQGARPGREGPRGRRRGWRPGCVSSAIFPDQPRRRGADVPCRGAVADSRRRHRGPADPRQDDGRRLGEPSRQERLDPGQRLDLGPDADWKGHRLGRRRGRSVGAGRAFGGAQRRTGDPPGDDAGDADLGPPVRHGPDHRGRPQARRRRRQQPLPPLLRHAGRGRAYGRRCGALLRRLSGRDRGDRRRRGNRRPARRAGHIGQAVGAASAL